MRKDPEDTRMVEMFFNSVFQSIDMGFDASSDLDGLNSNSYEEQYEDKSVAYNIDIMNTYLLSLFNKYLTVVESDVLRLSYGLDCGKHSANEIADYLGLEGASSYVRISEIKKQAIQTLINSVDPSQVFDYL